MTPARAFRRGGRWGGGWAPHPRGEQDSCRRHPPDRAVVPPHVMPSPMPLSSLLLPRRKLRGAFEGGRWRHGGVERAGGDPPPSPHVFPPGRRTRGGPPIRCAAGARQFGGPALSPEIFISCARAVTLQRASFLKMRHPSRIELWHRDLSEFDLL
ncbi:hypothetical protein NL676_017425 [Syzygium grande]|nr:hypothetical protein NL676_017425 [Syzygium grande]